MCNRSRFHQVCEDVQRLPHFFRKSRTSLARNFFRGLRRALSYPVWIPAVLAAAVAVATLLELEASRHSTFCV